MAAPKTGSLEVAEGTLSYTYYAPSPSSTTDSDQPTKARPPLVFIHSGVTDQHLWDEQAAYLSARGYPCLTYDLLGFGLSPIKDSVIEEWKAKAQPQSQPQSQPQLRTQTESESKIQSSTSSNATDDKDDGIIDHLHSLTLLITQVLPSLLPHIPSTQPHPQPPKPILIGLSMGAGLALEHHLAHAASSAALILSPLGSAAPHSHSTTQKPCSSLVTPNLPRNTM